MRKRSSGYFLSAKEVVMKQKILREMKTGFILLWKDIRRIWIAILVFVLYIQVGRKVLYSFCPSVVLTGFPCPGCGMTRAMFSILRGDFAVAWHFHPFAYAILIFLGVFGIRRYFLKKDIECMKKYLILLLSGMILFYVWRMINFFPGEPPMSYYYGSAAYRIWSCVLRNSMI